jgi:ubiquitin carboxyl-terminal hydrolase 48
MPRCESSIDVAAADVRLPPTDAWAAEVLQACTRAGYTPQRDLLQVLAPLPGSQSAQLYLTSPAPTTASGTRVKGAAVSVIDVDAEEDLVIEASSPSSCLGSRAAPYNGDNNGTAAYQPYLSRVVRDAPTAEMRVVRAALSSSLLRKAYRTQIPCVTAHSTKGDRLLNCAASPRCMSGLRTLAGDAVTREDCLKVAMGEGPCVVAVPATKSELPPPSTKESADGLSGGTLSVASVAAADATTETITTTARTVVHDPSFPCLWRGVRNLMNTCYFSSVLQMVFSVAPLRQAILSDDGVASTQLAESGLRELFALMAFSREGAGADPKSFASYLSLDVKVQQDAQEFFTLLLDWLRCHCGASVQTAVTSTFSGTLLYDRRCGACGRSAKRAEPFLYLSLPVRSTLEDSLSEFSKPEEVDGFMCEGCGKTAVATSRQYMRTLPDVLVVHWNRFEFDLQTLQRHKVNTATSFPLQLDMTGYIRQWHEHKHQSGAAGNTSTTGAAAWSASGANAEKYEGSYFYELRGIVNHHGDSAVSGHYTYHGKVPTSPFSATTMTTVAAAASSTNTWLNFNDAEVTPLSRYQGQRGVSADAYLLVYHRIAPSPLATLSPTASASAAVNTVTTTTATATAAVHRPEQASSLAPASAAAAAVAAASTSAAPTPSEFPLYLRQYADQVNQRCLDERQAWLDQRAQVAALFDLWAATAHAVFDAQPSAWTSTVPTAGGALTTYALPTVWLQQLGRFFLPAFVDVAALGGGAESQRKRNKKDTAVDVAAAGAATDAAANTNNCSGPLRGKAELGAAANGGDNTTPSENTPADGVVVSPMAGPRRHGYIQSLEELHQLVRQHSLLQALPALNCRHGFLAPWGAYKLISAAAFAKLSHFLQVCGAPLRVVGQADNTSSADVDAQTSCAFVDANLCPLCVAAMAATVQDLAVASAEDKRAELCLTKAWHDAEKKMEAEESSAARGVGVAAAASAGSPAVHAADSTQSCDNASVSISNDEDGGEVLVSESVVSSWASFYVSQLSWNPVLQTEGFTALVVLKEARLNPPRPSSSATRTDVGTTRGGATSPPSPTSPTAGAAASVSLSLVSAEYSVGIAALNVDRGDLDLCSQLLCPHGALRPGQHVLAIPASLRSYWMRRFAEALTVAHRTGQLRSADPQWQVTEEDIGYFLLPYIPASTTSTTCFECMRTSVQTLTSRHHQRLRKMEERKKFPSLWLAGAMTSPSGIAQLLLATGAENEEQLLAAQHPNRLFFKHNADREYREYVRKWTEAQQARIAHQTAEVTRLQTTVAKKKEHDAAWNARVTSRRSGGGGRSRGGVATGSPKSNAEAESAGGVSASTPAAPDPETLEGKLFYAEAALARLKAQPVPDFDVSYGCVPTWWVARWYATMQDGEVPASSTPGGDSPNEDADGDAGGVDVGPPLPAIAYREFKCEHGGCLLDVSWLNPSDGFWQGVRGKRAEVLWNGVQVERASTAAADAAAAKTGPGKAEYRSQCWLPPLVILPMEEYLTLLAQYGGPNMLEKSEGSEGSAGTAAAATEEVTQGSKAHAPTPSNEARADVEQSTHSPLSPVPGVIIQVVTHNGLRQLQPAPCADCCARLLADFEVNCESFVNGSLKLNFHIKKSRKNFYDASSVLTSAAVQQSKTSEVSAVASVSSAPAHGSRAGQPITVPDDDNVDDEKANDASTDDGRAMVEKGEAVPDGIHYFTTLAQLRSYISAHLRERHGYLVQPEDLQIMRGKNKPLKLLRSSPEPGEAASKYEGLSALEHASLHALGIKDGDTLSVQSVDVIAQVCTTAPGVEEEWEAIPPELLQAGGAGSGGGAAAAAAKEHTMAFRETRLQGSHATNSHGGGAAGGHAASTSSVSAAAVAGTAIGTVSAASAANEEQGVACVVCTFLNAPGMVVCEMCEAPLPTR